MPLTAHLGELRSRLIKSLVAVGVAFVLCYQFVETLMAWLIAPLKALDSAAKVQVIGTGLAEAFFTKLKVSFIAGIFLASPVIFYQIGGSSRRASTSTNADTCSRSCSSPPASSFVERTSAIGSSFPPPSASSSRSTAASRSSRC